MQALQLQDHIKSCYGDVLPALQLLSDTYSTQQQPSSALDVSSLTVPAPLAALHRAVEDPRSGLLQRWMALDREYLCPPPPSSADSAATATSSSSGGCRTGLCVPRGLDVRDPSTVVASHLAAACSHPALPTDPDRRTEYVTKLAALFAAVPHMEALQAAIEHDRISRSSSSSSSMATAPGPAPVPAPAAGSEEGTAVSPEAAVVAAAAAAAAGGGVKKRLGREERSAQHGASSSVRTMQYKHGKGLAVWRVLEMGTDTGAGAVAAAAAAAATGAEAGKTTGAADSAVVHSFAMHAPHLDTHSCLQVRVMCMSCVCPGWLVCYVACTCYALTFSLFSSLLFSLPL